MSVSLRIFVSCAVFYLFVKLWWDMPFLLLQTTKLASSRRCSQKHKEGQAQGSESWRRLVWRPRRWYGRLPPGDDRNDGKVAHLDTGHDLHVQIGSNDGVFVRYHLERARDGVGSVEEISNANPLSNS